MTSPRRRGALLLVAAWLSLLAGCGGGERSSHRPEELLGTPPAGAKYKVPDAAVVSQFVQLVKKNASDLEARDVAVRLVIKSGLQAGAVVVLDIHGDDRDSVFKGFVEEVENAGANAEDRRVAGVPVKQAEVRGVVATVAVEHGFGFETIAPDRAASELLMRPLLQRAAALSD